MLGFKKCVECPGFILNLLKVLAIFLILTFVIGLLIHLSHLEVKNLSRERVIVSKLPLSEYLSILLKILMNHIQIMNFVKSVDIGWPKLAEEYIDIQSAIGDVSTHIVSLECLYIGNVYFLFFL
jgi:hypothetical protein